MGRMAILFTVMKTTIEVDEKRLHRVMELTGIKTRRAAVDHGLREAERQAKVNQLLSRCWSAEQLKGVLDPHYDVEAVRRMDKPKYA